MVQVDVEMNSEAADAYGVTSLPTFIFVKRKKLLGRYEGWLVLRVSLLKFGINGKSRHNWKKFKPFSGRSIWKIILWICALGPWFLRCPPTLTLRIEIYPEKNLTALGTPESLHLGEEMKRATSVQTFQTHELSNPSMFFHVFVHVFLGFSVLPLGSHGRFGC